MNRRGFLSLLLSTVALTTGLARSAVGIVTERKLAIDTFVVDFTYYGEFDDFLSQRREYALGHQVIVFDDFSEEFIPYTGTPVSLRDINGAGVSV